MSFRGHRKRELAQVKDLLTTASSIIIILFCVSLFFLSEGNRSESGGPALLNKDSAEIQAGKHPRAKTTLFSRVQSVKLKKGVLMFVSIGEDGLREHFFLIRDKNVVLVKKNAGDMPGNSIKFDDDGYNTLLVTIPNTFDIDLMDAMTTSF
tara:strand:+ start:20743 stop:21195 length:453 start_codon:yes stop_codon:yes gene_type:complete